MALVTGRFGKAAAAGMRVLFALVAVQAMTLHAEDKEKDKPKEKKQEQAKPAPRPEAKAEPRQERRAEPKAEQRSEPRQEQRIDPRQERRAEPKVEQRAEPRQERRAEPKVEQRVEPSRTTRPDQPQHPGPSVRTETEVRPTTPSGRVTPDVRPATAPSRFSPEARPDPAPSRSTPESRPASPAQSGRGESWAHPGQAPARDVHPGPAGRGPERQVVRTRDGGEIHRTPSGAIREVRTPGGAVIRHSPSGVRQVEIVRPGGRVIVANASGRMGYIQRPLESHGHMFVQRTYIVNGVPHAALYRPWAYGGREYNVYMPHHHYHPAFYAWCYSPWSRPVSYRWGWSARPWFGYYGGYFAPYPVYRSPAFWLADFVIAATLESAYMAQNASLSAPPVVYDTSSGLTPEVKDAIADEVRRQMDQSRDDLDAGYSSAPPPLFTSQGPRIFVVASGVLAYAGNQECALAEGDVLQLAQPPSRGSEWAEVRVLATRGASCPRGSYVSVRTLDLQEMANAMQASMERGLAKLQSDQGRDGIPALPASARGAVDASYALDLQPDDDAQSELTQAVGEANASERSLISAGGDAAPSGTTISLGMTPAQVEAALGRPRNTVDLGAKKIYVYSDLKVTFLNGRVSDVQ